MKIENPGATHIITTNGQINLGDIGFARTKGTLGLLIRVGEWLKGGRGEVNHAFTIVQLEPEVRIVEATLKGVKNHTLQSLLNKGAELVIVSPPAEANPAKIVEFNLKQVGDPYGIISDLCIGVDLLTWDSWPSVRRNWTWICSALAGESLRYAGWLKKWGDIYCVTPQALYNAIAPTHVALFKAKQK